MTTTAALDKHSKSEYTPPRNYAELLSRFSDEEMALITQLKRFFECHEGDSRLRASIKTGQLSGEQHELLREIGVHFDLDAVSLAWEQPGIFEELLARIPNEESLDQLPDEVIGPVRDYPLLLLWARYCTARARLQAEQKRFVVNMESESASFTAWRRRRIRAVQSELGSYGYSIDHPILAMEVALGCSVGCPFCAFDAGKLQQVLDWEDPESRALFQDVSRSLYQKLGMSTGHALLYWRTEPHDNPHYIDFMRDFGEITGSTVCTATARSQEEWVRDLINHYRQGPVPWPRISVLSRGMMYRLYRQFSPDEFRDVTMLMQQKDGEEYRVKVPGGRDKMLAKLDEYGDLRDKNIETEEDAGETFVPQGSIACVSGFLINLIERTVKLISPCYTTREYSQGYRTYAEFTFDDAEDFDRKLHRMFEQNMITAPYRDMPMAFRDDLRYHDRDDGFMLVSPTRTHTFRGNEVFRPLGQMLARNNMTYGEVCDALIDDHHCNAMHVVAGIRGLFNSGLLDETRVQVDSPKSVRERSSEAASAALV
jgi:radical SAM family RiPP maturation amino acid epimerase